MFSSLLPSFLPTTSFIEANFFRAAWRF